MSDVMCAICSVDLNFVKDIPRKSMKKIYASVLTHSGEVFVCSSDCLRRLIK